MADSAFVKQYRRETIDAFEFEGNMLRSAVTTEHSREGNEAIFLVAGSGGASAVTRSINGRIPGRADDLNQFTATLVEWHDVVERTRFNIFASQGNARSIMQRTTVEVMGRKIDQDIIAGLETGTVTAGAPATASLSLVTSALAILGAAKIPTQQEDNMFFLASMAFRSYLLQVPEFSNADYVDIKPLTGPAMRMRRWAGFNWIFHPELPGATTSDETCFAFHRKAIGHAFDSDSLNVAVDYDERHDFSWARASCFMGTKRLQNSGIVKVRHDGSAFVGV